MNRPMGSESTERSTPEVRPRGQGRHQLEKDPVRQHGACTRTARVSLGATSTWRIGAGGSKLEWMNPPGLGSRKRLPAGR